MDKKTKEILKSNNEREELINKENDEVLTDIICYLRGSDISEYDQELVRADIIEMVLDAQERGEDIKQVFGGNYKEICDNIIAEFPKKTTKQKILEGVNTVLMCLKILGFIWIAKQLVEVFLIKKGELLFTLSVGDIVNGVLIIVAANIIVQYVCKNSFKRDENKKSIMDNKVLGFIVIWVTMMAVMLVFIGIAVALDQTVVAVPLYMAIVFVVLVFLAEKVTDRCM